MLDCSDARRKKTLTQKLTKEGNAYLLKLQIISKYRNNTH